ncbi:peptide chain release factor N(5)-glutamine methyltransferase [Thioflexithrix psekupsensis]|uniref:Release factor glutamine methyltransferase n=1 Tax=Thioflexithrix psekupsensis TaxID=1570016 RepID=A0A251X878_9GAMM|nr:peptide chain release factor N(5)-glutamine methyltransferase [Thioflexithrix psekupsensis]OUD13937.1 protein-(glutamine-N5) methyltransferase, release factor-specific [Thioflexithrix psekupsensis]
MRHSNIQQALKTAYSLLNSYETATLESEILLGFILECSRSQLRAYPERTLTPAQYEQFINLIHARAEGVPIAYLTGQREFWSLPLIITNNTLIPRSDTELLVELALCYLPKDKPTSLFDLGTGSGAIALAIAYERANCQIIATDLSLEALTIAQQNAVILRLLNIQFQQGNWFDALMGKKADLIVSNPPYLAPDDPHLQQGDLRYEPPSALIAPQNGLADLITIIHHAPFFLNAQGWLLLEHGYQQGQAVRHELIKAGFQQVQTHKDYAQHERVSCGQMP